MRIKVGDQIFDGSDQPIMAVLDETDKKNIANMPETATRYCLHPPMMDQKELDAWMNNPGQLSRVIEGKLCIKDKVKTVRIFGTVKPGNEEPGLPSLEDTQMRIKNALDMLNIKPEGPEYGS